MLSITLKKSASLSKKEQHFSEWSCPFLRGLWTVSKYENVITWCPLALLL